MEDNDNNDLRSIVFRFESPEGGGDPGRHSYWHVQLTSSFESNEGLRHPSTPTWFPQSTPAFPLDAGSASTCVVSLAVALYDAVEAYGLVEELRKRVSESDIDALVDAVKAPSMYRANRRDQ